MASQLYPLGKKAILDGDIDFLTDTIKAVGVDTADEAYSAADQFLSQIAGAGIVLTTGALTGKTTTGGLFDANDITVLGVAGDTIEALVLFKDTGVAATSALIGWFDVATFTPNAGDVTVIWNSSGIFAI